MRRFPLLLLGLLAAGVRLYLWLTTNYAADDAFITFRYAENIAAGAGFVYNLGEHVLGTTTPLFTLALAGLRMVGLSIPPTAVSLSLIASAITTIVLYLWGRDFGMKGFALLPALAYTFSPRSLMVDISGMETALFTMLVTVGLYAVYNRRGTLAITTAGLAALTRPEGWLLLAVAVVAIGVKQGKRILWPFLSVSILLAGWIVFAWLYFGSPIPNSMAAKLALYHNTPTGSFFSGLSYLLGLHNPIGIITSLFWLLGTVMLIRERRPAALLSLFVLIYFCALASGEAMIFHWYGAPVYPVIILIAIYPLTRAVNSLAAKHPPRARVLQLTAVILLLVVGAALLLNKQHFLKLQTAVFHEVHRAAGEYLAANAGLHDTVMAEDIGYFGYAYRGSLLDRDGLVTPAAIPYNREQRYWSFVDSVAPNWLFFAPAQPTAAGLREAIDSTGKYELVKVFAVDAVNYYWLCRRR